MEVQKANLNLAKMLSIYASECDIDGIAKYRGVASSPRDYLKALIERESIQADLVNGNFPSTTYYCISQGEILGAIRFREGSTPEIENSIGNIGYETKPSARNKGVATFLLRWLSQNVLVSPAIITCAVNNKPSQRVIERCGGQYLGLGYDPDDGDVMRYKLVNNNYHL